MGGAIACGLLFATAPLAVGDDGNPQWTMGGHDLQNSRNQSKSKISPQNAAQLKTKWVFTTGGDVVATPAVFGGTVYFPDFAGNYYAVDAQTGTAKWSRKVSDWTGIPGDYARNYPAIDGDMLILGDQAGNNAVWNGAQLTGPGARVIAVNRSTGQVIWVTQVESFPAAMVTSSPVVFKGVVYVGVASAEENVAANPAYSQCCVSRGSLVALDQRTGQKLWQTYMVPDSPAGYSGGGIWDSTPVIDAKRNSIYVGTGNNYSVPGAVKDCNAATPANKDCTDSKDYFDSVVALDLTTGKVKWATRALAYDAWNVACIFVPAGVGNCPNPEGPDFDFGGSGPNLISVGGVDILGIGEKSGVYWALNPDNGKVIWNTLVGPGSSLGGIEWGTAFDGQRIYVPIVNLYGIPYALQPSGTLVNGGSWAALDPATGKILWQTATPGNCSPPIPPAAQGCMGLGPASVGNGVVFVGSMDVNPANPTMFALDAATGKALWSYVAGSSVLAGPAIVGNTIYWGTGYGRFGPSLGTGNNKLFAFSVGGDDSVTPSQ
jgi:polyvinyl alcohol dehydrogenase (cytochrome)